MKPRKVWITYENGDYYQGGTYIGFGPMKYVSGHKVECAVGEHDYLETEICRVESPAYTKLLLEAGEMYEIIRSIDMETGTLDWEQRERLRQVIERIGECRDE